MLRRRKRRANCASLCATPTPRSTSAESNGPGVDPHRAGRLRRPAAADRRARPRMSVTLSCPSSSSAVLGASPTSSTPCCAARNCDRPGLAPDRHLRGGSHRAHAAARRLHGARLPRRAFTLLCASRATAVSVAARRPEGRAGLEVLRALGARVQRAVLGVPLRAPADPGHPSLQPEGFNSGTWDVSLQHRVVVCLQHQLAVLRRGDDALLLLPDGRARRAELHLCGGRHLGGGRSHPRLCRALGALRSATSGRTSRARCSTCCCRSPS